MTSLVTEELQTTLAQSFTLKRSKRYHIEGVKPYIMMYNAPSGTFTISLKSGVTTLGSKTFTSASIKSNLSTSNNYAHLYLGVAFDNEILLEKGTYSLELSSSGYTYSASSFIGWVKEHDQIFFDTDYTPSTVIENPLSFYLLDRQKNGGGDLRILDFADGFSSASAPSTSGLAINQFERFANDAAYEAANGAASGSGSEVYYNTTDDTIRMHDGINWREVSVFNA